MPTAPATPQSAPPSPAWREFDTAEFEPLRARFAGIQGYLNDTEGYALHRLARERSVAGEVVEIGSFMGKSTCWLAEGARLAGVERVSAVDHFKGSLEHQPGGTHEVAAIVRQGSTFEQFEANVRAAGLWDWVRPIRHPSLRAVQDWTAPVRLLFIDGDHSYGATLNDFNAWSKFVVPGGVMALHDVGAWAGVTRFYLEMGARGAAWGEEPGVNSLRVFRRKG